MYEGKINIINYIDIITLEDNRISVKYEKGIIIIKGKNLALNKLLDREILITGKISSLEFE
jgi:sporulation protein YqfC